MNSEFDLALLADPTLAQLVAAPPKPTTNPSAGTSNSGNSNSNDWLLFSEAIPENIAAPHPDLFERDIDSLLFDTDLSSIAAFPSLDFDTSNHNFYQYRSPAAGNSTYSGYGPSTFTASSESLSAYGSTYDALDQYAVNSVPTTNSAAISSLFKDIDLSAYDAMLPRRTSDADVKPIRSSNSAYDSASPVTNTASYFPGNPSYLGAPARSGAHPSASTSANGHISPSQTRAVPVNGNSALVGANVSPPVELQSDADPRKKYQCPTCPRAFARAFNLKTHLATHDPHRVKSFQCHHSGCGRSFSRKHDLGRHLVSIHQDNSVAGSASVAAASGSVTRGSMAGKAGGSTNGGAQRGTRSSYGSDGDDQVH